MLYKYNKKNLRSISRMLIAGYLFFISSMVVFAFTDNTAVSESSVPEEATIVVEKDLIAKPITFYEIEYNASYNKEYCKKSIDEVEDYIQQVLSALDEEELYTDNAVHVMSHEYNRLLFIKSQLEIELEQYNLWEQEHYYAAKVFEFLIQQGYSREVACGIIGNMMVECGGHTLNLKPFVYSPSGRYYGLCQWNIGYGLHGSSFERQLEFLVSNIEREFNVFGKCYQKDFDYESFISLNDVQEAALAFAESYERCCSSSFNARKQAASEAYSYFTLE